MKKSSRLFSILVVLSVVVGLGAAPGFGNSAVVRAQDAQTTPTLQPTQAPVEPTQPPAEPPAIPPTGDLSAAGSAQASSNQALPTDQIIIKYKAGSTAKASPMQTLQMQRLNYASGTSLKYLRPMSGNANVLSLPEKLPLEQVQDITRNLMALPEVEYAEPDQIMLPLFTPNDQLYGNQWDMSGTWGINAPAAWDITTGSSSIVVADIDTGITNHAEFSGRTVPGYDFISNIWMANDEDGRDSDPSDPGDWVAAGACYPGSLAENSSWHGTHTAGTIGATGNNLIGVAGINWNSKILPVRVLGRCGGYDSDITDGMRWAAGLSVIGVPNNSNPARVMNISLGGGGSCDSTWQNAINAITAAGTVVVVAAGNSNSNASTFTPASCNGVITVAATGITGSRASYSNYGASVEISAPGGDGLNGVLSTLNTGTHGPVADTYAYYEGTSMATPHVTGVVSLMFSVNPSLTPAQVLTLLQSTARAFPSGKCDTNPAKTCGSGILDAGAAVAAASPVVTYVISGSVGVAGATITYTSGSTVSTAGGSYSFHVASGWTGTVTPTEVGYTFTPDHLDYTDVTADQPDQNYVPTSTTAVISGTAGVAGATITYTGGSTSADGSGNYSITVLKPWSGTVTPSKTGTIFTPDHIDYADVTSDQTNQNYSASTAPTDISLSNADINEALPSGTVIGTFTNNDPDIGDTWTYTLVAAGGGCPGTDNASFQTSGVNGGTLQSNAVFDYEVKSSYDICVQVADTQAHTFQKPFTITILNRLGVVVNLKSAAVNDGWILESTPGGGTGGSLNASASTFQLGDDASNRQYRSILSFDTSTIPNNAVLTRVTLKIRRQAIAGSNPFNTMGSLLVDTRQPFFGTMLGLETADFNAAADHSGAVSIPNTPDGSGWYSVDLPKADFDAVNIGGTSQFRLRFATASNGNNVADLIKFYSGSAGAASRPLLIVEYGLPSATFTFNSVAANDGWILESAQASGVGGSLNSSASTLQLGDDVQNRQYRSIVSFNTAALPDNAIITGVTLQVRQQSSVVGNPFGTLGGLLVDTRKPFFDGALALQKADFNASADHLGAASIPNTPDINGWYSVDLPSSDFDAVNPTGTSQFRLRFGTSTNTNGLADLLLLFSGSATAGSRPILSVDYTLP